MTESLKPAEAWQAGPETLPPKGEALQSASFAACGTLALSVGEIRHWIPSADTTQPKGACLMSWQAARNNVQN